MRESQSDSIKTFGAQLVTIVAGEDNLPQLEMGLELAHHACLLGGNVLIIDCLNGQAAKMLGVQIKASLQDVLDEKASLSDAKHITPDGNMSVVMAGTASLDVLLGPITAMSLSHDWVFVVAPSGCTPTHVRLMSASDHNVLIFDSKSDRFMRAYWLLDAVRARAPQCDPHLLAIGEHAECLESYDLFAGTVKDFLGAAPALTSTVNYDGPFDVPAQEISLAMRDILKKKRVA